LTKPLIVFTGSGMSFSKTKMMVSDETPLIKTSVSIQLIKEYLFKTEVLVNEKGRVKSRDGNSSHSNHSSSLLKVKDIG
jgi:hypothetical protein